MNPLGVKGVGEAGTIGCSPAVVNSVVDALSPLGRAAHRHAADARENLEADSAGRPRMIPQIRSNTPLPPTLQEALALLADGDAQDSGRRHEPDPADEAAAGRARRGGGPGPRPRPQRHHRSGGVVHIGAMATHHAIEISPVMRAHCPLLARDRQPHRRRRRCATWAPSAAASRMPIRRPIIPPRCWRWKRRSAWLGARRAHRGGQRFLPGRVHHGARTGRDRASRCEVPVEESERRLRV